MDIQFKRNEQGEIFTIYNNAFKESSEHIAVV